MPEFTIKAWSMDYFEKKITAKTQEEAEDNMHELIDNGELPSEEGILFFEGTNEFEMLDEIYSNSEEIEGDDDEEDSEEA